MRRRSQIGRYGAALVSSLLLLVPLTDALAQPHSAGAGAGPELDARVGHLRVIARFLQLSEEQRQSWVEAHDTFRSRARPLHEEARALAARIREELESAAPDLAALGGLVVSQHQLHSDLRVLREELAATLSSLLDAEQQVRWEAFQAAQEVLRRAPRGPRRGPHGPDGPRS